MILQSRDDDRVGDNLRIYGGYPAYIWGDEGVPHSLKNVCGW